MLEEGIIPEEEPTALEEVGGALVDDADVLEDNDVSEVEEVVVEAEADASDDMVEEEVMVAVALY